MNPFAMLALYTLGYTSLLVTICIMSLFAENNERNRFLFIALFVAVAIMGAVGAFCVFAFSMIPFVEVADIAEATAKTVLPFGACTIMYIMLRKREFVAYVESLLTPHLRD